MLRKRYAEGSYAFPEDCHRNCKGEDGQGFPALDQVRLPILARPDRVAQNGAQYVASSPEEQGGGLGHACDSVRENVSSGPEK